MNIFLKRPFLMRHSQVNYRPRYNLKNEVFIVFLKPLAVTFVSICSVTLKRENPRIIRKHCGYVFSLPLAGFR